jgi:hypothetical protein
VSGNMAKVAALLVACVVINSAKYVP